MIALKRYTLCLALIFSHAQPISALDSVEPDIGEIIIPEWGSLCALEDYLSTLSSLVDENILFFYLAYFIAQD